MGLVLLLLPLAGIMIFALVKHKNIMDWLNVCISSVMLAVGIMLTKSVLASGFVIYPFFGGYFFIDSLSIIMVDIVLVISLLTGIYSAGYLAEEIKHGRLQPYKIKTYYILLNAFVFTMLLALTVKNMGIMWIAIEATTLASAFLVGLYNDKKGG